MKKFLFTLLLTLLGVNEPYADLFIANKKLEIPGFPEAFNPSMIEFEEGYLLTFRYLPDSYNEYWISYIGLVRLNKDLKIISSPQLLETRLLNSPTPSQSEDARIFSYRGRIFLIYNDNLVDLQYWWRNDLRRDMFIVELFYDNGVFSISTPLKLINIDRYESHLWQKNWIPFIWEDSLFFTYMLNPHEVIQANLKNGLCSTFSITSPAIDWNWGKIRGSTPAVLMDGQNLAFFHSSLYIATPLSYNQEAWHYYIGAYTFSPVPPFEITQISASPLVAEEFYSVSTAWKHVIFPGGFVVEGNLIHVVYGRDDCELWVATIDYEALKETLIPVAP